MNKNSNLPEITIQPAKKSYVSKQRKTVKLFCQARNSNFIQWKCNGKLQRIKNKIKKSEQNNNNENSIINSSFTVKYSKLENYLGFDDYFCTCLAYKSDNTTSNDPQFIESDRAIVYETYLNKRFLATPKSGNVMLGEPFLLKCKPPYGEPEPEGKCYMNIYIIFDLIIIF